MKSAIIIFPGTNREREMITALGEALGNQPYVIWHGENNFPQVDLIVLPGGFSYGDYLRPGSMAANSPIIAEIINRANRGVYVLGICNGFQVLTEARLLPGALMRNIDLNFICREVYLRTENPNSQFLQKYNSGEVVKIPVAHHDGNYYASEDILDDLEQRDLVAFRYCSPDGQTSESFNPNGSKRNIAGIYNHNRNVLGMMPHPENAFALPSDHGRRLFMGFADN